MDKETKIEELAEDLGLDADALKPVPEYEPIIADMDEDDDSEEPKKKTRMVETSDENEKAMEIEGIPANFRARPIAYDDEGNPQELRVRWNKEQQEEYRNLGRTSLHIKKRLPKKRGGDTLQVFIDRMNEEPELLLETNNYSRGYKRAKTWAVLLDLAFDPESDVTKEVVEDNRE